MRLDARQMLLSLAVAVPVSAATFWWQDAVTEGRVVAEVEREMASRPPAWKSLREFGREVPSMLVPDGVPEDAERYYYADFRRVEAHPSRWVPDSPYRRAVEYVTCPNDGQRHTPGPGEHVQCQGGLHLQRDHYGMLYVWRAAQVN